MKSKQTTTKTLQVKKDVRNPHPFHCDCGDKLKERLVKKISKLKGGFYRPIYIIRLIKKI
jgi:hypothetical protein